VNAEQLELREGTIVLIQRRDRHEIRNTGDGQLKPLNVYVPPHNTLTSGRNCLLGR
jgi:mannose-6-phosphate isomerase-like protein (cupin superfamily)